MHFTQLVGIAAGVFTAASMIPQLIKMVKNKKSDDVSVIMLVILISGLILWIAYGFLRKDLPILITNFFSLALNLLLVFFRLKFSRSAS